MMVIVNARSHRFKRARERERERRMGGDQQEKVSVEVTLPETITLARSGGPDERARRRRRKIHDAARRNDARRMTLSTLIPPN